MRYFVEADNLGIKNILTSNIDIKLTKVQQMIKDVFLKNECNYIATQKEMGINYRRIKAIIAVILDKYVFVLQEQRPELLYLLNKTVKIYDLQKIARFYAEDMCREQEIANYIGLDRAKAFSKVVALGYGHLSMSKKGILLFMIMFS